MPAATRAAALARAETGFTMLELMLVILVLGIIARFVWPAFVEEVPAREVEAETRRIAAKLAFLRSEARLQSGQYGLEIDPAGSRYRIRMPREKLLTKEGATVATPDPDEPEDLALGWVELTQDVVFLGVHVGSREPVKENEFMFDATGRTLQKVLMLGHRNDKNLVWSVFVPSLGGSLEVTEGRRDFATATDADF